MFSYSVPFFPFCFSKAKSLEPYSCQNRLNWDPKNFDKVLDLQLLGEFDKFSSRGQVPKDKILHFYIFGLEGL